MVNDSTCYGCGRAHRWRKASGRDLDMGEASDFGRIGIAHRLPGFMVHVKEQAYTAKR